MIKTLRFRFVAISMAIVFVAVSVVFYVIFDSTRSSLQRDCDVFLNRLRAMPTLTTGLGEASGQSFLVVDFTDDGEIWIINSAGYEHPASDMLGEIISAVGEETEGDLPDYHLHFASEVLEGGTRYFFVDNYRDATVLADLSLTLLSVGGVTLVVFFFITLLLSNWAMEPVRIAWAQQKQFISDASHELKTPITIISTNAEMIRQKHENTDKLEQRIEHIQASAERLQLLTNSLLQLTRAEGGQREQNKTPVNMSRILETEALSFEALFFEKNLTVQCDIADRVTMLGQETALRQLIAILLDNAYKYSYPNTEVQVGLTPYHGHGRQWVLSVTNQGAPIEKDALEQIFHRFYRADASRGQVEGYGLGLSIAKAISESHGGKLWAENCDGKNTFSFRFFSTISAS